jgi:hypothetical protein
MSRKIITNNKDIWKMYSTVVDKVVWECNTEEDFKKAIALEKIYDGKLQAIEDFMMYPNGWIVNDKGSFDRKKHEEYYDWIDDIYANDENIEEDRKKIDAKLIELLG